MARERKRRGAYWGLVGKHEGKIPVGKLYRTLEKDCAAWSLFVSSFVHFC